MRAHQIMLLLVFILGCLFGWYIRGEECREKLNKVSAQVEDCKYRQGNLIDELMECRNWGGVVEKER